jgi:hypothetical protein
LQRKLIDLTVRETDQDVRLIVAIDGC